MLTVSENRSFTYRDALNEAKSKKDLASLDIGGPHTHKGASLEVSLLRFLVQDEMRKQSF